MNCTALPVWYNKQRSVWVNSETLRFLFTEFICLAENFLKKKHERKTFLVIDNALSHNIVRKGTKQW